MKYYKNTILNTSEQIFYWQNMGQRFEPHPHAWLRSGQFVTRDIPLNPYDEKRSNIILDSRTRQVRVMLVSSSKDRGWLQKCYRKLQKQEVSFSQAKEVFEQADRQMISRI